MQFRMGENDTIDKSEDDSIETNLGRLQRKLVECTGSVSGRGSKNVVQ